MLRDWYPARMPVHSASDQTRVGSCVIASGATIAESLRNAARVKRASSGITRSYPSVGLRSTTTTITLDHDQTSRILRRQSGRVQPDDEQISENLARPSQRRRVPGSSIAVLLVAAGVARCGAKGCQSWSGAVTTAHDRYQPRASGSAADCAVAGCLFTLAMGG